NNAPDPGLRPSQTIHVHDPTTHFECARGRVVLMFHRYIAAGSLAQLGPCVLGCGCHHPVHKSGSALEFVERDGRSRLRHRVLHEAGSAAVRAPRMLMEQWMKCQTCVLAATTHCTGHGAAQTGSGMALQQENPDTDARHRLDKNSRAAFMASRSVSALRLST